MEGKTIILAGGSGGLGRTLADYLAGRGARPVLGCFRDLERAQNVAADIESRHGISVPVVAGDVLEAETRARLIDAASSVGPLYGLVPLVGEPARVPIEEATEDDLLAATRINFVAPVLLRTRFRLQGGPNRCKYCFCVYDAGCRGFPGKYDLCRTQGGVDPRSANPGAPVGRCETYSRQRYRSGCDNIRNG